jgi:hypothetical protein
MEITLSPAKTINININEIKILSVNDFFDKKRIVANIKGLPKPLILWDGETEYAEAGVWTNETATQRVLDLLQANNVKWGF